MRPTLLSSTMKKLHLALLLAVFTTQLSWSQFTVSGTITTEDGEPVSGVTLAIPLTGTVALTDMNGYYQFVLPVGASVDLVPFNNNDPLNGVSTFDVALLMAHSVGSLPLDSPYKVIAADADNSGFIDIADSLAIRNVILGLVPDFPNNTSWRFVDASYVFPDPTNPFSASFPEAISINNLSSDLTDLNFVAIKTADLNGTALTTLTPDTTYLSKITGKIYFDQDETCSETSGDTPLGNRKVVATGTGGTFYGSSQSNGIYNIFLPNGTFEVYIVQPNGLWEACVESVTGLNLPFLGEATVDFAEQALDDCPLMEVNLGSWGLRRCFDNIYHINYCNQGTITATDASVEVTLDPFFANVSSSIPWTSVNGSTYTFDLGDVPVGECGNFSIFFELSCDAELGQTHCTYAHIYPDESCVPASPLWNGGDLLVTGECSGGDVVFTITNKGEDMSEPMPYVVIEDIMIQMEGNSVQLAKDQSTTVTVPANGSTWRLQANEVANHPFETFASATVEGCGTNGSGNVSLGFVNQFPLPDQKPFEDLDCQENIGSFDPNDKTGYPYGYGTAHFIEQGQDITYRLRFQNTGTDTAFNILIVDTLPEHLDPATIRLHGSSHPMEFELEGRGVAKFRFPNIMLPDSNVNEAASHGFVKFTIAQQPNLAIGTAIENEAGIYFDFNDPVITNRTLHTIGEELVLEVTGKKVFLPGVEVAVSPNPFETTATFRLEGYEARTGILTIYDQQGRQVSAVPFTGNQLLLDGTGWPAGLYFFKMEDLGRVVATGKINVK